MKVAIFVPPKNFRDETLSMVKLMLDKWKVENIVTSYTTKECIGRHGAVYKPGINTAKIDPNEFDGIILIDGEGVEEYKLFDFRPLLDLIKRFYDSKKLIGAVGNAIKILARANVIMDTKVSAPVDEEMQRLLRIYYGINSPMEVEYDKNIVTARNPDNAASFAQLILEKLGVK